MTSATTRRDRLVDVAFMGFALVAGFALFANQSRQNDLPGWAMAAGTLAGVAACAALWARRRHPLGVAVAILPVAVFSSFATPAGLVAFFTVAVHRRFAAVAWLGAGALAVLFAGYLVQTGERPELRTSLWLSFLSILLLHIAVAASGMYVRARRLLLASLRERAERAEAAQHEHAQRAREQERARIAREMHDVLAHRISLLSMHAGSLEFRPDADPADVARSAGVIRESAHAALQDLRTVIGVLRDGPADDGSERPQPTLGDLAGLVEESRAAGMTVRASFQIECSGAAPDGLGRDAFRIVQEGLTNARKHADGTAVTVTVTGGPGDGLRIDVRNPQPVGRTASVIPGAGAGLIGLAERVALAGGHLGHGRSAAGDFRLHAWLPWTG